MVDLAAIGRARPSRNIADVIQVGQSIQQQNRLDDLARSRMELESEQLSQIRRKGQWEAEEHERMSRPISVSSMADHFVGGENNFAYKRLVNVGKMGGHIYKLGNEPVFNGYGGKAIMEWMSEPENAKQIFQDEIDYANARMRQINTETAEGTGAAGKKFAEEINQLKELKRDRLLRLGYADKLEKMQLEKDKLEFEKEKETTRAMEAQEEFGIDERRLDIMEERNRILASEPSGKAADDKTLQRLEDDIRATSFKIESIRSGQDILSEAFAPEKAIAILKLERELNSMLGEYIKAGGKPGKVGFPEGEIIETGTVIVNKQTGERLEWDGSKWVPLQ